MTKAITNLGRLRGLNRQHAMTRAITRAEDAGLLVIASETSYLAYAVDKRDNKRIAVITPEATAILPRTAIREMAGITETYFG